MESMRILALQIRHSHNERVTGRGARPALDESASTNKWRTFTSLPIPPKTAAK